MTLIDFKSGDPDSDNDQKLDEQEMKLQVAIYAVGAKKELEYQPDRGLVRYLDGDADQRELSVPLGEASIRDATALISETARKIRDRAFNLGPVLKGGGSALPDLRFPRIVRDEGSGAA